MLNALQKRNGRKPVALIRVLFKLLAQRKMSPACIYLPYGEVTETGIRVNIRVARLQHGEKTRKKLFHRRVPRCRDTGEKCFNVRSERIKSRRLNYRHELLLEERHRGLGRHLDPARNKVMIS